jgi:hypothetical protein
MKRSLAVLLVLGLAASFAVAPAQAKKKKKPVRVERTAQGTYAAPATVIGNCTQVDGVGCMTIVTGGSEQYLTASATDATGQPVFISVQADLDGDMQSDTNYGTFCGETAEPIKFDKGASLIFWVGPATGIPDRATSGCVPGQGTQGTLDVTFSNMP